MMKHMLKWYFPLRRCSPPLLVLTSNWFFHVCSCVHLRLGVDVCILKAISNAHTHFCCKICVRQQHVKTRLMRECVLACVTSLTHTAALLKQRRIGCESTWVFLNCLFISLLNVSYIIAQLLIYSWMIYKYIQLYLHAYGVLTENVYYRK